MTGNGGWHKIGGGEMPFHVRGGQRTDRSNRLSQKTFPQAMTGTCTSRVHTLAGTTAPVATSDIPVGRIEFHGNSILTPNSLVA